VDPADFEANLFLLTRMKALSSKGFAKKWTWQNLVFKELRYQNLENKTLRRTGFALSGPSLP
jgi:hypothetical protein